MIGLGISVIVVSTKIDALTPAERLKALHAAKKTFSIGNNELIQYSSWNDEGKKELWGAINIGLTAREEQPNPESPSEVSELYDDIKLKS